MSNNTDIIQDIQNKIDHNRAIIGECMFKYRKYKEENHGLISTLGTLVFGQVGEQIIFSFNRQKITGKIIRFEENPIDSEPICVVDVDWFGEIQVDKDSIIREYHE